jgi:hypothetical protein
VVKKSMLAKGLSTETQKALVVTPVLAYCLLLHTVSHTLESLCTKEKTEWPSHALGKQAPTKDLTTMDWELTST